jgi:ribosomal protein S18 acetylase RimI-like enzyme
MIAYPQIDSLIWREISSNDSEALAELDRDCKRADGDEPVSKLVDDVLAAAGSLPDDTLCGVRPDGKIAALGWIRLAGDGRQVTIGGRVHPDYRRRGLGTFLIAWAEDRAEQVANSTSLVISNESLTEDADKIYARHGYSQDFAENMMVRDLNQPIPSAPLPENIMTVHWTPGTMGQFFAAYRGSFADRPGFPDPPAEEWIGEHNEEPDFRPDISMVALADNAPIAFVTCFVLSRLGWIGQIGVIPTWRKRGVADTLLVRVMEGFRAERYDTAGLHVNINNPRAAKVYERLGFVKRLQRTRYVKTLTV